MRMLLFFDLPSVTNSDLKEYRKFRKFLIEKLKKIFLETNERLVVLWYFNTKVLILK